MYLVGRLCIQAMKPIRLLWGRLHSYSPVISVLSMWLVLANVVVECWASQVAQWVSNPPALQEMQVRSLHWEDPWRRAWQPTPVFLPGESHGHRNLVGYSLWCCKESDTTEHTSIHTHTHLDVWNFSILKFICLYNPLFSRVFEEIALHGTYVRFYTIHIYSCLGAKRLILRLKLGASYIRILFSATSHNSQK